MKGLWARLTGWLPGSKKAAPPPRPPLENPYRRFYTSERSFEELARQARERQKEPPKR
ncbi:hypothetical protein [Allofournierella sp. CML151]|uniref:hypothetical protein n=1 Tax=Allofournierella sp. CML151 TaxID=2998082 RepID=UPI0022EA417B|nr:hypothetical protein [Fournierella sp. CML151]